jgi:predicted GTPase
MAATSNTLSRCSDILVFCTSNALTISASRHVHCSSMTLLLQLTDTAQCCDCSTDCYHACILHALLCCLHLHRAHACILVFDVTRKTTYKNLTQWYNELRQYCENVPCILVANKIDVDYNVSTYYNYSMLHTLIRTPMCSTFQAVAHMSARHI